MTKQQLSEAVKIARDTQNHSLENVDQSVLRNIALPSFKPVTTTTDVVAKLIRENCVTFDGGFDSEEFDNIANMTRHKVAIV